MIFNASDGVIPMWLTMAFTFLSFAAAKSSTTSPTPEQSCFLDRFVLVNEEVLVTVGWDASGSPAGAKVDSVQHHLKDDQ